MQFISGYFSEMNFRDDSSKLVSDYIASIVRDFFKARQINVYLEIPPHKCISPYDFKNRQKLPFTYFYDILLKHLADANCSLTTPAYTVVHDVNLTSRYCDISNTKYESITLGKHPVFYYIYIDLQEIFDFLRQQKLEPLYEEEDFSNF